MSRIGLQPITIPQGVEVNIKGSEVVVKGGKGELRRSFNPDMAITLKDGSVSVSRPSNNRVHRSLHGLTRTLIANMVEGVSQGFTRDLELNGVGYRVQKSEGKLVFQVGFSHQVEFPIPQGLDITVQGANRIQVMGINKEVVGNVAAKIRAIRPPDHYKGKGIKYAEEHLRLKPGKAGKVGAKK